MVCYAFVFRRLPRLELARGPARAALFAGGCDCCCVRPHCCSASVCRCAGELLQVGYRTPVQGTLQYLGAGVSCFCGQEEAPPGLRRLAGVPGATQLNAAAASARQLQVSTLPTATNLAIYCLGVQVNCVCEGGGLGKHVYQHCRCTTCNINRSGLRSCPVWVLPKARLCSAEPLQLLSFSAQLITRQPRQAHAALARIMLASLQAPCEVTTAASLQWKAGVEPAIAARSGTAGDRQRQADRPLC